MKSAQRTASAQRSFRPVTQVAPQIANTECTRNRRRAKIAWIPLNTSQKPTLFISRRRCLYQLCNDNHHGGVDVVHRKSSSSSSSSSSLYCLLSKVSNRNHHHISNEKLTKRNSVQYDGNFFKWFIFWYCSHSWMIHNSQEIMRK